MLLAFLIVLLFAVPTATLISIGLVLLKKNKQINSLTTQNKELKEDLLLIPVEKLMEAELPILSIISINDKSAITKNTITATDSELKEFKDITCINDITTKKAIIKFVVMLRSWYKDNGKVYGSHSYSDSLLCSHYHNHEPNTKSYQSVIDYTLSISRSIFGTSFLNNYVETVASKHLDAAYQYSNVTANFVEVLHHELLLNLGITVWCKRYRHTSMAMAILNGLMGYSLQPDLQIHFNNNYDTMGIDTFVIFCKLYLQTLPLIERCVFAINTINRFLNLELEDYNYLEFFEGHSFCSGKHELLSYDSLHGYANFEQLTNNTLKNQYLETLLKIEADDKYTQFRNVFDFRQDCLLVDHIQQFNAIRLP